MKADALIAAYVDNLPEIEKERSSREWYYELRSQMDQRVSVSKFNMVRFLSKFRQLETEED